MCPQHILLSPNVEEVSYPFLLVVEKWQFGAESLVLHRVKGFLVPHLQRTSHSFPLFEKHNFPEVPNGAELLLFHRDHSLELLKMVLILPSQGPANR
jgi:hypothetical protein